MLDSIGLFALALLKHWWALLSCALFTGLGVYAAATNKSNAWVVAGSGVLAFLLFLVAAFMVWRDEHQKYATEVARNRRPDINGEAFNFSGCGIHGDCQENGHWSAETEMTFERSYPKCPAPACVLRSGSALPGHFR